MKRPATTFVWVLIATSVFWILGVVIQKSRADDMARNNLKSPIPAYAAKVEKTVAGLQGETPSESVSNLYYVTEYFNPGPATDYITDENQDQVVLDSIMSNRRFRKSFSELGKMDKAAASQLVKTNLMSALTTYSHLYEQYLRLMAPRHKITTNNTVSVPVAFTIGFTKPEDEGRETLMGEKMKVFSLVWISGMLKLTDNRELVEQVVRLALKQRTELDNDPTLEPEFKGSMLRSASLYNRQILSSGLIGVTFKKEGMESNVMKTAGIQWQQRTLAAYEAALTEFDKPVQSGVMAPDLSTGSLTVNYVSPMNDTNFDLLLQEIHFNLNSAVERTGLRAKSLAAKSCG